MCRPVLIFVTIFLVASELLLTVQSIPVDNGVVGDPEVKCGDMFLGINFKTRNPFIGHVFVKDHYGEPGCRMDETNKNNVDIQLTFTSCGVRRMRSANPRGLFITTTVIITFHSQFITKVDRAYAIKCFYMEADKIVTTELEVSMLTTSFQTQTVPMPTCRYEVLDNGPTGTPIRYAKIGDQVYHKWTCDTATSETFCMVVHSCKVDDGAGNTVILLDANGCAQDKFLLGNLEYLTDLMAGRESHVFKRPVCSEPPRGKRDSNATNAELFASNRSDTVDVDSDQIIVLDLDPKSNEKTTFNDDSFEQTLSLDKQISSHEEDSDVCMSLVGFSGYTAFNVLLIVSSAALFLAAYQKHFTEKASISL